MTAHHPPSLQLANGTLQVCGSWLLEHYSELKAASNTLTPPLQVEQLDFSELQALDTAGAAALCTLLGADRLQELLATAIALPEERSGLLEAVCDSAHRDPVPPLPPYKWLDGIVHLGQLMQSGWKNLQLLTGFTGMALTTLAWLLPRPHRWRMTALVAQIHQTGLNAVPIVALLTFLVGAVVAFLGATVLSTFGAAIYTVDLVAYSFLREFGVLLTAILLAGRTASAFTAQLGAMKANEEIDALRTIGLDPVEVLVIPRLLALLIVLPLLTFVAMLSGLVGGAMVSWLSLDISLTRYTHIVAEVGIDHFLVGIAKAPFFAALIALIGCLEGFKVTGSAESVGEHTTSSVVQSIFGVILLDALAALFFMEMGW